MVYKCLVLKNYGDIINGEVSYIIREYQDRILDALHQEERLKDYIQAGVSKKLLQKYKKTAEDFVEVFNSQNFSSGKFYTRSDFPLTFLEDL